MIGGSGDRRSTIVDHPYGVLSYLVSLVITQLLRLAAVGLSIGVVLALGAARIFGWRVMMLQAFNPLAYLAGTVVVVSACLAASFVPACRAARLDPMSTLRAD